MTAMITRRIVISHNLHIRTGTGESHLQEKEKIYIIKQIIVRLMQEL